MFLTCVTSCRKSPRSNKLEEIEDIQMSPRSQRNVWRLFRLFAHYYLHLMSGIFMNNNINSGFCIITSIFRGGWTNKLWQYGGYQITFYAALILWWWSRRIRRRVKLALKQKWGSWFSWSEQNTEHAFFNKQQQTQEVTYPLHRWFTHVSCDVLRKLVLCIHKRFISIL